MISFLAHVEVDPNLVNPPPNAVPSPSTALTNVAAPAKKKKIHLHSSDTLFAELRDKNFAVCGPIFVTASPAVSMPTMKAGMQQWRVQSRR